MIAFSREYNTTKRNGSDDMAVVKNIIPKTYENEEERKRALKRVYVSIQRTMYLNSVYGKKSQSRT